MKAGESKRIQGGGLGGLGVLKVCNDVLGGWVGSGKKVGHIFGDLVFGKLEAGILQRNGTGIK